MADKTTSEGLFDLHGSFGSIVAQVAEVSLADGALRVYRVVCATDCGTVVNPGIVAQQMEGAVAFALTPALYGRIDIHEGMAQQKNFPQYATLKLAQPPQVETHLVARKGVPGGVGEPGVPPLVPAVANALFRTDRTALAHTAAEGVKQTILKDYGWDGEKHQKAGQHRAIVEGSAENSAPSSYEVHPPRKR